MENAHNTKIPVKSGAVPAGTVNGASAKVPAKLGSPSGSLAKAPPGSAAGSTGGKIAGFGSGAPDSTTVNGASAKTDAGFGSVSGNLAAQGSTKDGGKGVKGFSGSGIKPGKI